MIHGSKKMIHGTAVSFMGVGILILGPSGSGKSDLALRLIHKGAFLIADDQVIIKKDKSRMIVSCPDLMNGLLEVRGIGICQVSEEITKNHEGQGLTITHLGQNENCQLDEFETLNKSKNNPKASMERASQNYDLNLVLELNHRDSIVRLPELVKFHYEGISLPKYTYDPFAISWFEIFLILIATIKKKPL